MNCFPLDHNMAKSVEYHCDTHVVKIILEGVQMLSSANRIHGSFGCYKMSHEHHPMTVWAAKSQANYDWMRAYVLHLNTEWQHRWHHNINHKSVNAMLNMPHLNIRFSKDLTPMPACMPDECLVDDTSPLLPVVDYRNYYQTSKQHIAKWTNRPVPAWYTYTGVNTIETRKKK
jgi:hypothetical protein